MKITALALIVALFAGCASKPLYRVSQGVFLAANVADVASTHHAIASGNAREANPLLGQSMLRITLAKAASTTFVLWWVEAKVRDDHPKLANALLAAMGVAIGVVAVRNEAIARRGR
jgi:hypothetical protein